MEKMLLNGTTLLVDRYSFSGVAFSAAKKGMNFDWCKQAETGLLKPDLVLLFKLGLDIINKRSGWGNERYEESDFQLKVADNFQRLYDKSYWMDVNADKSIDALTSYLMPKIQEAINKAQNKSLTELW